MSTDANAPGALPTLGHIRGLDGIRALSVLAIVAFHTGLNSVPGGFYGVDAFFVLSGFLITSLLVKEWGGTGTIRLRRFWAGRARRLLPALFVLVAVIGVVLAAMPRLLQTPHVMGDALSTVFYVSNWYSIHAGVGYFSLSAAPSPLLHTWSLAIEEQFYLIWPLVVLGVLKGGTGRRAQPPPRRDHESTRRRRLRVLFVIACLGSLGSALVMARLAPDGYTTRAYYGTDTRAQALLVGAAVAIGLTLWREGSRRRWFVRTSAVLAIAGMVGTAVLWMTTAETSTFAFKGGFLLASLAAGSVVLGCAVAPRSLVVRLLELPPLPQWGRISYGVYLWYWPVLLVMTGQRLHWGVYPLFLARVGITVAIAALSHDLVEMPIRHSARRRRRTWVAAPIGAVAAMGAVFISTLVPVSATELQGSPITVARAQASAADGADPIGAVPAVSTPPAPIPMAAGSDPYLQPPVATAGGAGGGGGGDGGGGEDNASAWGPTPRPVKVLLVGDSVAGSLGVGLAQDAAAHNVQIVDEGTPGCSLSMTGEIRVLFYSLAPGAPCDVDGDTSLFDTWRSWVDAYNPDVVVYVARGETFDQDVGGRWQNVAQATFARKVESRYREAVAVLGSRGASVVLMTTPYYSSGTSPSGTPWPEDDPARVETDNSIVRAVSRRTSPGPAGGTVHVYDLNALVSPGEHYAATMGQVNVRCADGVHFSRSGGILVGLRLVPDLAALGQAHASSSPGGAWAGRLPPSTPRWFPNLPCQ